MAGSTAHRGPASRPAESGSHGWTFLTNHAHVLLCIAEEPDILMREVAVRVGITERATQRIVAELEDAGYVSHRKVGRRNHYEVDLRRPMRHPLEASREVGTLLSALSIRR